MSRIVKMYVKSVKHVSKTSITIHSEYQLSISIYPKKYTLIIEHAMYTSHNMSNPHLSTGKRWAIYWLIHQTLFSENLLQLNISIQLISLWLILSKHSLVPKLTKYGSTQKIQKHTKTPCAIVPLSCKYLTSFSAAFFLLLCHQCQTNGFIGCLASDPGLVFHAAACHDPR